MTKGHKHTAPPKRLLKLLRFFIKDEYLEEIEGDMEERYQDSLKRFSTNKSQLLYLWDTIKLLRPKLIKGIDFNFSNSPFTMFRHNLILSFRNFKRYKTSFLINLTGLSIGLACTLLIYLWISDELKMDRFHENGERLFHVLKSSTNANGDLVIRNTAPVRMAEIMAEDFPEIDMSVAVVAEEWNGIISYGEKRLKAKHLYAGKDYFNVFSYKLLEGDRDQVLTDPSGVVLSDELAMKLFNTTENLVGTTLNWEWWDNLSGIYTIKGIFEAPSSHSSKHFDLIFTRDKWIKGGNDYCWCSNNAKTYLVLNEETDLENFNEKIRDYSKAKLVEFEGEGNLKWEGTLQIQKYSDLYLHGHFENGVQVGGRIEYVKLFGVIGIFILVIACINFMNLSTARASRRVSEVGIKKAFGVRRTSIMFQYMGESMLIALLSLSIALALTFALLPFFESLTNKALATNFDLGFLLFILGTTLITGILSGSYPALYLSGFNPHQILKGQLKSSISEKVIRKGLVIFQFAISVMLMVAVVVIFKQIDFIQTKNLGYDKDNIIRIENEGKLRQEPATFIEDVKKIVGVINASTMSGDFIGHHSGGGRIHWEGKTEGLIFDGFYVHYDLIETMGFELAEGRTFSREYGNDHQAVLFNETAIARMGLTDPIGKTVQFWGENKKIIGVVKDFHYESFYKNVEPFFFSFRDRNSYSMVKIAAGREKEVLERIKMLYERYNNGVPFDYSFIDNDYEVLYAAENRVASLSRYFSFVAILISCLGLFGLVSFTAERRQKEIGIRKVLGANEISIVGLLSSEFTKTVLIAIMVSLPLSYLFASDWLEGFAYRIKLEWWFFVGTGLTALIISWMTLLAQTLKAAAINPVNSLKDDL